MRRHGLLLAVVTGLALSGCLDDRLAKSDFEAQTAAELDALDGAASDAATDAIDAASSDASDAAADVDAGCKPGVGACDDDNPCTTDSCINSACTHVAVLDLTPCTSGGKTGTCKKGVCQ